MTAKNEQEHNAIESHEVKETRVLLSNVYWTVHHCNS